MNLIFATHNNNKLIEVKALMPINVELKSLNEIGWHDEIPETELTIEGNALLKAKTIFNKTNSNCFADDSGLIIPSLNGEPGVFSARYAGEPKNDELNLQKVLNNLKNVNDRSAHFKTTIALIIKGNSYLFEGIINGEIIHKKIGTNGFGYDPIFVPDGYTKTFAQLTLQEKSSISHRAIAVNKMVEFLKTIK